MGHIEKLLRTFEFEGWSDLVSSLFPSVKYSLTLVALSFSAFSVMTYKIVGLDILASVAFVCVMILEVLTGIIASKKLKVNTSSVKMSRFSLKMACYFVVLFVSNSFAESFKAKDSNVGYWFFDWLHVYLAIHIATENIISIIENWAIIEGKPKTYWIVQIQEKLNSLFITKKNENK